MNDPAVPVRPDGERYLRLLLEDVLAGGPGGGSPGSFHQAARVLVAARAVEPSVAAELEWDLALASSLRDHGAESGGWVTAGGPWAGMRRHPGFGLGPAPPAPPAKVEPVPVAAGPASFDVPGGRLTVAFISTGPAGRIHVVVQGREDPDRPPMAGHAAALHSLRITDDSGVTYRLGGGDGGGGDGYYTFDHELAPDPRATARWFDVTAPDGTNARLPAPGGSPRVAVARRDVSRPPAEVTLLEAVVSDAASRAEYGHASGMLPVAVDTLVGAGLLPPDHALVVHAARARSDPSSVEGLDPRLASALRPTAEPPTPAGDLTACWALGMVVSSGGADFGLDALTLTDGRLELHGRLEPWDLGFPLPFVVMARDEHEQWYLGHPASSGRSGRDPAHVTIRFLPARSVDPVAREFVMVLIDSDAETDIAVPLSKVGA